MTDFLKNQTGNEWQLTTPQGQIVDTVIAPSQAEAALAVAHLVPRDGAWQGRRHGQYAYRVPGRIEVARRARQY